MDKWQWLQRFWGGFGLPAYDESSVPEGAEMPYITYAASAADFEHDVSLTASLWYQSTSWSEISQKADEIAKVVQFLTPQPIDGGRVRIWQGNTPFAQRMSDPGENIRRIVINIMAEFMTAY